MVRLAPKKDGAIAWHDLALEYEPPLAVRWCAQLAELLTPDWTGKSNQEFLEALMTWERQVSEYGVATGLPMLDPYKRAVILRHAPEGLRNFLRAHPEDVMHEQLCEAEGCT